MTKKIDYSQFPGLLHKNDTGEWGMWRQDYLHSTFVYWEAATQWQTYFCESYEGNRLKEFLKKEYNKYLFCLPNIHNYYL